MVSPIKEMASVMIAPEVINKSPNNTSPGPEKTGHLELVKQVAPEPKASDDLPVIKASGREGAEQGIKKTAKGEVRKSEISDGQVTIKVYDNSGKLLRKIPPGYLPVGEQKFDITV